MATTLLYDLAHARTGDKGNRIILDIYEKLLT